jgi:hypothetical protein
MERRNRERRAFAEIMRGGVPPPDRLEPLEVPDPFIEPLPDDIPGDF